VQHYAATGGIPAALLAHPLMLRAIVAAKKKNDKIDAGKIADCLRCDFLPECHMVSTEIRDRRRTRVRRVWIGGWSSWPC
jgi:hypothetical protein